MNIAAHAIDTHHPDLTTLVDYWRARQPAGGGLPAFADIDLMDLYAIARLMIVGDVEGTPPNETYRWRFAGSTLRDIWGVELTGKTIEETHDAETVRDAIAAYRDMAARGAPQYWMRPAGVYDMDKSYIHYERVMLPLAGADGTFGHVMGVYAFYRQRGVSPLSLEPIGTADTGHVVELRLPPLPAEAQPETLVSIADTLACTSGKIRC